MTPYITDLNFLSNNQNIEEVIIYSITIKNIDFYKKLPNLKSLVIVSPRLEEKIKEIDLINNTKIEYIELRYCKLNKMIKLINVPKSFKYLKMAQ